MLPDRARFAKCFVILVEECKSWLQVFAGKRVKARSNCTTLRQFITSHKYLSKDTMISKVLANNLTSLDDFDITVLRSIIVVGNLLDSHERMSKTNTNPQTIGDFVERIREIRNNFMHTTSAVLDELEYDRFLAIIRDIAERFEIENNVAKGYYVKKINDIDDSIFDTKAVEETILKFNVQIELVIKNELSTVFPESEHTTHTIREQESPQPSTSTENRKISKKINSFQLHDYFFSTFSVHSIF